MVARTFFAIDSAALSVTFSTTQNVGDSVINNSDTPDGTTFLFGPSYDSANITVDDTSANTATLEDDDPLNHIVTSGGALITNGTGIEAESLIYIREMDAFGNPTGPTIIVTVFSQNGVTADVWGFATNAPMTLGAEYVKVGGSNIGTGNYADYQVPGDGIVDGTDADDSITVGYLDAENDAVDGSDGLDDLIFGYAGSDTIDAGLGNDTIYGDGEFTDGALPPAGPETYDDLISGGVGNDSIFGGYGADTINGGTGSDTIAGGQGSDVIDGGDDNDLIFGDFSQNLADLNSSSNPGGTPHVLDDAAYDGAGRVTVDLRDYSGGDRNVAASVNFQDDPDPAANPLTQLNIRNIGRNGDLDVMNFDMSLFDDDFLIRMGGEGPEDRLIFDNVLSSTTAGGGQTVISYMGKDGAVHTVTVEATNAQIEINTAASAADFAADGDTILGGAGDDTIDGGFGDDSVSGESGNDTFLASTGNDTLDGGSGTDTYQADGGTTITDETINVSVNQLGNGSVTKVGDGSTDTIVSVENFVAGEDAAEADSITLTDNVVVGTISALNDTSLGTFTTGAGDVIAFGGAGMPTINDILSGTYIHPTLGLIKPKGVYQINSGEEDGAQLGAVSFSNFENIAFNVVCFAGGTHIETDSGEVAIEKLVAGDLVLTMDHGLQPIRWIGSTIVPATGKFAPVRIAKGTMGNHRDLIVSPQHRMMLEGWQQEMLFGELQTLAPAINLINDTTITRQRGAFVEYFHILFDNHEIVFAEGAASESFHPGSVGMDSMAKESRAEILDLFPELARNFDTYGPAARMSLKGYEAKLVANSLIGCMH